MIASFLKNTFFLVFLDVVFYYAALFAAIFLRSGSLVSYPYMQEHVFHFTVLLFFLLVVFFSFRLYEISSLRAAGDFLKYSLIAFLIGAALFALYFYFLSSHVVSPKTILLYFFLLYGTIWHAVRFLHRALLLKPVLHEKLGVVDNSEDIKSFVSDLEKGGVPASVACAFSNVRQDASSAENVSAVRMFCDCMRRENAHTVVLSRSALSDEKFLERLAAALPFSLRFFDVCAAYEHFLHRISIDAVDQAWFLRNISKPVDFSYEVLKRSFDVVIGIVGVVIMILVSPLIFLAVKLEDGGPVFFMQSRAGKGGKPFILYKFRTMDFRMQENGPLWAERHDRRTMRIGRILRRFHIDEVPQAVNILKGDMSFVGPRAERKELAELFGQELPFYSLRHIVRPGVTGWAQLHYPASASVQEAKEKLQYDLFYVKNRSFFLDLEIIFKTITIVFFKRKA